jgi:hypothetical protein
LIAFTIGCSWATISVASSPQLPADGKNPFKSEPEFTCAEKTIELSREQLEEKALAEFERKARRLHPGQFETKLKRQGCDWWVFVTILPYAPGAHFGVLVDGVTGQVKSYVPGA